jgi:hypothetical protein
MGLRGEIYSTKVVGDRRVFFLNVKEDRNGNYFLNVVETKKEDEVNTSRHQIIIYEEEIDEFIAEFQKASKLVQKQRELKGKPNPLQKAPDKKKRFVKSKPPHPNQNKTAPVNKKKIVRKKKISDES